MAVSLVLATLLFAQATPAITVEAPLGGDDVGYRELVAQRPADAIARIDANRMLEVDDPAALINRGTARARLGDQAAAIDHYRAAIVSRQRYDLELADGTWMDSRAAARLAVKMLAKGEALALR
jgi:hypothetical protein